MKNDDELEPINRFALRPFLYQQVNFCGQMILAQQKNSYPYQVLLSPVEIAGIRFDHVWLEVPQLRNRLLRNHVLSPASNLLNKQALEKLTENETIHFTKFVALAGNAFVNRYAEMRGQIQLIKYGIKDACPIYVLKRNDYIMAVTNSVAEEIAQRENLTRGIARQEFLISKAFRILTSFDKSVAGLGTMTFFNLYENDVTSAA